MKIIPVKINKKNNKFKIRMMMKKKNTAVKIFNKTNLKATMNKILCLTMRINKTQTRMKENIKKIIKFYKKLTK